jgi:hypothetical protein
MKSWRDVLPIHPAAELFSCALVSPDEKRALGEDIIKNGLISPIVLWKPDRKSPECLLDGITRLDAIEIATGYPVIVGAPSITAGEDFLACNKVIVLDGSVDPYAYVISANIRRRHLTIEDKDKLIAELLKLSPTKSNRQVAKLVGASHPHIAKVRKRLEKTGDVETVSTSVDTKGRRQPTSKGNTRRLPVRPQHTPPDRPNRVDRISSDSLGDIEHLSARNKGMENTSPELESEKIASRQEIESLRGPTAEAPDAEVTELNDLLRAWDRATEAVRRAFVARVGLQRVDVA